MLECLNSVASRLLCGLALMVLGAGAAAAQPFESAGQRARGMGGAFVALADDSSAVWWNPAALAAGPFFDASVGWTGGGVAPRTGGVGLAASLPMIGLGWMRTYAPSRQLTPATATPAGGREDNRGGPPSDVLRVSQFGVTLVHTLVTGVHVGATLKYMRGSVVQAVQDGVNVSRMSSLDPGRGGGADGAVDADVGLLVRRGRASAGLSVKNLMQPVFSALRLDRRVRVGAALEHGPNGPLPFTFTIDMELVSAMAGPDARRVLALGAERWTTGRRFAVRAGTRLDTDGAADGAATVGASAVVGAGVLVEAHGTAGGPIDGRGWGVGARVSF